MGAGMDLTIYIAFPYLAGDKLGILRAEVYNKDFFCHGLQKYDLKRNNSLQRRLFTQGSFFSCSLEQFL
jgi:hypothetical protein